MYSTWDCHRADVLTTGLGEKDTSIVSGEARKVSVVHQWFSGDEMLKITRAQTQPD